MDDLRELRRQYGELLERLQRNEREFRRLGRAVWQVQEDERRRLARELHDGIGQNLTALKHRLLQATEAVEPGNEALRLQMRAAIDLCGEALEDTRHLSRLLRPPILDDLGLEAALRWLARSVGQAGGPEVEVDLQPLPELDGELQTLLFRVAQEALNNATKHSGARSVLLRVAARGNLLHLHVADDGRGCDPVAALRSGGSGLGGMRERLRLYDGRLDLHSAPGEGMRVRAVVPIRDAAEPAPT